jgi:L-iditol 2-dehydrogenase
MKAAVFDGPERIEVREISVPACEPDGLLVRVMACGICGSDVRNFRAGLRNGSTGQIIGHEIAGIVERVGAACARFAPGDRVAIAPDVSCGACHYCSQGLVNLCVNHRMIGTHWPGGFAQYLAVPAVVLARGMVHPIPAGLSFAHAALAEPLSSVLAAQESAGIGKSTSVAIFGTGPVGCLHAQIARNRGAGPVILVGRRRLGLAAVFRPDLAVHSEKQDPVAAIIGATGGIGAEVAIVATPSPESQAQAVEAVRKRGTVILFGGLPKEQPYARLNANRIHYHELRVQGSFSYPAHMHVRALETLATGQVMADACISSVVGLSGIVDAILASERGEVLKVIVDPWM